MMESESLTSSSPKKTWSQTRRGRRVVFVGIAGLFVLVFWMAMKSRRIMAAPPALMVDEQSLSFGEVWEDPAFVWSLPITNTQRQDVEIKQFRTTCTCIDIEPKHLVIPAKQKRDVRLSLNLATTSPKEAESFVRNFEVRISPEVLVDKRGSNRSTVWTIRGWVRSAIRCYPSYVDFGRQSELEESIPPQRVQIRSYTSLRQLSATCTPPLLNVEVKRHSARATEEFDLVITPKGSLPLGVNRCSIAVVPELSDSTRLPPKSIAVRCLVVSDIEASPAIIMFGANPLGATVTETIVFHSLTGHSFKVTAKHCEGVGLSVESIGMGESLGPAFTVKQKISTSGDQKGAVVFQVSSEDRKEREVVVPVSSYGVKDD